MIPESKKQNELDRLRQKQAELKQQEKDLRAKIRTADLKANRQLCFAVGQLVVQQKDDTHFRLVLQTIQPQIESPRVGALLEELLNPKEQPTGA